MRMQPVAPIGWPRETPLPLGFVGKDKLLVQGDFNAGASVEFLRNDEGNVAWMRFGGRIQTRAAD